MKTKSFLIFALLCTLVQGAWATDYNVSNEAELRGAIENGANITLTQDITIGSAITFNDGITVTIDLGGHTLNRNSTSGNRSQVIGVFSGSTLNISNGTLTGGWGGDGGIINQATLNMTNVTITGNKGNDRGGGISNNGTLTMTDCTVSNNTSLDATDPAGGGGIFNYSGKTATLTNCTITGNTANTYGGGGICNYGTMTLENCSVKNNNANTKGGGIFNSTSGTLSINGCDITGNSAVSYGDGIYIDNSTINMQGLCKVTGNTDSNIYLYGSGTVITVTGAFTDGSNIGLGVTDYNRKLTSGYGTYNSGTDPGNFFTSDNYKYGIGEKNGEAFPGVHYIECSWEGGDTDGHVVKTQKLCTSYTIYSGETKIEGDKWYLLSGETSYDDRLTINDKHVKLILMDGCNIEFKKGIYIRATLSIYAQSGGTGKLRCSSDGSSQSAYSDAALGGDYNKGGGILTIHGGYIEAKPGDANSAAIGGGANKESDTRPQGGFGSITIWDGNIKAEGKSSGAGIGTGQNNGKFPEITIYGGTINAKGGSYAAGIGGGESNKNGVIKIYGGNITAQGGSDGAGIGGGENGNMGNEITIYGGTVNATGGSNGAGIGGGENGDVGKDIKIYGGTITAKGGSNAAGIGGGTGGKGGTLYVYGGTIEATGGSKGAGIGGGKGKKLNGNVYIYDGTVTASGGKDGAGIGGGHEGGGGNVHIFGGTTTVEGNDGSFAIGGGDDSGDNDGTLEIGDGVRVKTENGNIVGTNSRVSTVMAEGKYTIDECTHTGSNYTYKDADCHRRSCSYCNGVDEVHDHNGEGGSCSKCAYGHDSYTVSIYEALADGSGYNSTPITYTVGYGVSFNLPECTSIPGTAEFLGWAEGAPAESEAITRDGEETLKDVGATVTVTNDLSFKARYIVIWSGAGTGTQGDPYQVSSTTDWDNIATNTSNGCTYNGKYFKLMNDISTVTTMIGTSSNPFLGNFDGDGHKLTVNYNSSERYTAPFRYIKGSTIKNLHVAGTITTSDKFAGGMIAVAQETNTINNCQVSANISSSVDGDGSHGGFVGYVSSGGTVNITRCAFVGKFTGSKTTNCGGFVGWLAGDAANITNCLFDAAQLDNTNGCSTFCRNGGTITNCYYEQGFGTAQGTVARYIKSGQNDLYLYYGNESETIAELQQYENEVRVYSSGLLYKKKFYAAATASVTFTPLTTEYGKGATNLKKDGLLSELTDNGDGTYTLAMHSCDNTITATIETYGNLTLNDATANTETLETNSGQTKNVTLSGRTLYKDGDWNTLCLPFDVSEDYMKNSDHPFYGATIMELDTDGWYDNEGNCYDEEADGRHQTGFEVDGTLYLYFQTAKEIDARRPYLIKWATATPNYFEDPVFYNSTIEASIPKTVRSEDGKVSFIANFDPVTLAAGEGIYYLGSDNKLYTPSADRTMNSFRAYFKVDLESAPAGIKHFSLNFGKDEVITGIIVNDNANDNANGEDVRGKSGWFTLQGIKLNAEPTTPGIYIKDGIKVIK